MRTKVYYLQAAKILAVIFALLRTSAIFLVWFQVRPDIYQTSEGDLLNLITIHMYFFYQFSKMCVDKWRICKIFGSFYRFVRLFWLCDLAWKSSLLHNKICSIDQIFFMTFQFQVSKLRFWTILEFFDFLEPDFHGVILSKIDISDLNWLFKRNSYSLTFLCFRIQPEKVH